MSATLLTSRSACPWCGGSAAVVTDDVYGHVCGACAGPTLPVEIVDETRRREATSHLAAARTAANRPEWLVRAVTLLIALSTVLFGIAALEGSAPKLLGFVALGLSWLNVAILHTRRRQRRAGRAMPHVAKARLLAAPELALAEAPSPIDAEGDLRVRIAEEEPEKTDLEDFDERLREAEKKREAR